MTIVEASRNYNIPVEILQEYESWGLCTEVKKVMGNWQYDDEDIRRLSLIMTLHDCGFVNEEIRRYMELELGQEDSKKEQMELLDQMRTEKLDLIHFHEKQLETLDYLRNEIRKYEKRQKEEAKQRGSEEI